MNSANVGDRSRKIVVKHRDGKPCSLKRHFKGCLRQVIGFLDLLAARDPERFVWATPQAIQERARKWKDGGSTYVRSQIYLCLQLAEQFHIIEPAERMRGGYLRKGHIVVAHDAITSLDGRTCTLWPNTDVRNRFAGDPPQPFSSAKSDKNPPLIGQQNSPIGQKQILIGQLIGQNHDSDRTANRTPDRTQKSAQAHEGVGETGNDDAALSAGLSEVLQGSSPVIPVKSSLVKESPVYEPAGACAPPLTHTGDLTHSGSLRSPGGNGKTLTDSHDTLGDRLHLRGLTVSETIQAVTDGEFDISYLDRYKDTDLLADCCVAAADEYEAELYRGRWSLAAVMGLAMELLRERHNVDAPRGWLPVMKRLRQGGEPRNEQPNEQATEYIELPKWKPEPEQILTDGYSTLAFWSRAFGNGSLHIAAEDPQFMALLIEIARKQGVPGNWSEGLTFAEAVIAELLSRCQAVPEALTAFRDEMKARTGESVAQVA